MPTRPDLATLLLHLDAGPLCDARTEVALHLARAFGSHLVGLAPTGLIDLPANIDSASSLAAFAAGAWDSLRERAEACTRAFRAQCEAAHFGSFESLVDDADICASLLRHAHCADLVVLTQPEPRGALHRAQQALVEQLVLYSPRPTLLLPYAGRFEQIGTRALVAWDDSREAVRALTDALPFLRRAQQVTVVHWNERDGSAPAEPLAARLERLRHWLLRHGVAAELRAQPAPGDIAQAMLSLASDLGADLIVMGAYGHARWAERMLGGATRGVLGTMTVPVLMSH